MKNLVKVTLVTAGISIFYIALKVILDITDIKLYLRTWADVLGKVTAALILPLMIIATLVLWLHRKERIPSVIKGIFTLAAGAVCMLWAYFTVLLIAFSVPEERMIAPDLLVTKGLKRYTYYRPVALLFKTPTELTDEIKIEYLEKKYNREFMTDMSENDYFCDKELPDVKVSVKLTNMELSDNYVEQMTLKYLTEGYQTLGIKRSYHISDNYDRRNSVLYMEFDGEADISALSADISEMIRYCMAHTDLFREYNGHVGLSSDKGEHEITFFISFGKTDYDLNPDSVAEVIAEKYAFYADLYSPGEEREQQFSEAKTEEVEDTNHTEAPRDYVEEDAKALYDAVFADEGFSYTIHYNAKGNLSVELGEKDGYNYSLVYDHPSKNGACELFVLYKFTEDTTDHYIIVDMYAVETVTKRVVASGKKHWSDVGTKEYRDITETRQNS